MSNTLTPLVPEKTYAVCTNGTKRGEMVVGHHDNVMKKNTCLFATIQDKPTNFACVYMGMLIAIIGALLTALFVSGVGATIGCLLLAALAGILAAYGLGGIICYFCLRPSPWIGFHPKVIINGEPAILGTSTIICQPLWFTPGNITLFYSKEVADRVANVYRWSNWGRIFNSAITWYGIPSLLYNAVSGVITQGFIRGIGSIVGTAIGTLAGGTILDTASYLSAAGISSFFSERNPNLIPEESKLSSVSEREEYQALNIDNLLEGDDMSEWSTTANAIKNFKYSNADRSRIMLWRHRVWGKFRSGNSVSLKRAWRWDKQLGPNKQSARRSFAVLGLGLATDIAFMSIDNILKDNIAEDFPELENAEAKAIAKVGVYEKTI